MMALVGNGLISDLFSDARSTVSFNCWARRDGRGQEPAADVDYSNIMASVRLSTFTCHMKKKKRCLSLTVNGQLTC